MFSDNIQHEMKEPFKLKLMGGGEKQVSKTTYTRRELDIHVEQEIILTDLDNHSRIIKKNKVAKICQCRVLNRSLHRAIISSTISFKSLP